VATIKNKPSTQIMIGFGINKPEDVADALRLGEVAVVGSAIIKRLQTSSVAETLDYIGTLIGADA
jgi:tryptophan synthase alpha subunit